MVSTSIFGQRLPYELQAALLRQMSVRRQLNLIATQDYIQWISDPQLVNLLNAR